MMIPLVGNLYRCQNTNSIVFKLYVPQGQPEMFLTYDELAALLVTGHDVCPNDLNMGVIHGLWAIKSMKDVAKSTVLARSAKNALSRTAAKAARLNTHGQLATQGLTQQLIMYKHHPHAFAHPAIRYLALHFMVCPNGTVAVMPELCAFGLREINSRARASVVSEVKRMDDVLKSVGSNATVQQQHDALMKDSDDKEKRCVHCTHRAKFTCACCGERFCSRVCQRPHWDAKKKTP